MRTFTPTRLGGALMLGSRAAAAAFTRRHVNLVRRYCVPVACDVTTRADLYDLDAAAAELSALPRRERVA